MDRSCRCVKRDGDGGGETDEVGEGEGGANREGDEEEELSGNAALAYSLYREATATGACHPPVVAAAAAPGLLRRRRAAVAAAALCCFFSPRSRFKK